MSVLDRRLTVALLFLVWTATLDGAARPVLAGRPQAGSAVRNPSVIRGPYLQMGTPAGVTVRWRTDLPTDTKVWWGPSPGNLTSSATRPGMDTEHELRIAGLTPGTKYFYAVGSAGGPLAGGDSDHFFQTYPAAGGAAATRIWVIGDSGTADESAGRVRDAFDAFNGTSHVDVWLMLGDNAYWSGTDIEYQAAVFDMYPRRLLKTILWPTLGNHDGYSASSPHQSGPYYDIFTLPRHGEAGGLPSGTEAYYSFDHGEIHFICLDSHDTDRSAGGAMMQWLRADLAGTVARWIIAFWHHPPYTKGSHDSDNPFDSDGRLFDMRRIALPILEAEGVDLVLTGHSHSYERSFLLNGHYGTSQTLVPGMIRDKGDGRHGGDGPYVKSAGPLPRGGAVYAVAGSSGQTSGGALNHPAMFISLNTLGSLVLDVTAGRLTAAFVDDTGQIADRFTLLKDMTPAPPGQATSPDPVSGATEVSVIPRLGWTRGSGSTSSDIHFGTNPSPGPAEFRGNVFQTGFTPATLSTSTTYYWRIDERNRFGMRKGAVWRFTTGSTGIDVVSKLKARYDRKKLRLTIEARSSQQPKAVLTAVGIGELSFDSKSKRYRLTVEPLAPEEVPPSVRVVSSLGGAATKKVKGAPKT